MTISSQHKCILPLVAKNLLDSMNRLVYTDDIYISSLYAEIPNDMLNYTNISIFPFSHIVNLNYLKKPTILSFRTNSIPCDTVLHIPANPFCSIHSNNDNYIFQNSIASIIKQYNPQLILGDVFIKLDINTMSNESDLDNIALNYVLAIKGILIYDLYQIKQILINIHRNTPDSASMEVWPIGKLPLGL